MRMRAQRMARDAAEAGEAGTQAQASALPCSAQAEPVLQRLLRVPEQRASRRRVELHESKILPGLPTCPGKRGGTTVTDEQILQALRCLRVETGSLSCLGCGHEHRCNVHGCQILREAAARLEHFIAENRALRSALASRPAKRAQRMARGAAEAGEADAQAKNRALPCSAHAQPVLQRLLRVQEQRASRRRVELHESGILSGLPARPEQRERRSPCLIKSALSASRCTAVSIPHFAVKSALIGERVGACGR